MPLVTQLGGVVLPPIQDGVHQETIDSLKPQLTEEVSAAQARLRYELGRAAYCAGQVRLVALPAFERMLEIARALPDPGLELAALSALSTVHDHLGQRHQALREAEDGVRLAEAVSDQVALAYALNDLAQFHKETGNNPRTFTLGEQIRAIGESRGRRDLVVMGLISMGRATAMISPDVARGYYREALAIAEDLDNPSARIVIRLNMADWQIYTGAYADALRAYDEVADLAAAFGYRSIVGRTFCRRGQVQAIMNEPELAWQYLKTGLPTILSTGDIEGELHTLLTMARLYVDSGDIDRACELYQRVLDKSILAPDSACAAFAQHALNQVSRGQKPSIGILPIVPVNAELFRNKLLLQEVHHVLAFHYPTGDQQWGIFNR